MKSGADQCLYEGGIRMPFIVRWPGHVRAGQVDESSVLSAVDLFPSLCAIANVPLSTNVGFDGEDLSAALLGTKMATRKTALFWEYGRNNDSFSFPQGKDRSPNLAVREGNWKLLINTDGRGVELYDLAKDPSEQDNLATSEASVTTRLSVAVLKWRQALP